MTDSELPSTDEAIHEDRLWRDDGWTARVIKNEDDDGWAVEMIQAGEAEPALVGPWTMGRDKKNPKPLDANAFRTLVKTASEVLRRHEQQRHAMLHKNVTIELRDETITVTLDIVPDEDDPYADLKAFDAYGEQLAHARVSPHTSSARRTPNAGPKAASRRRTDSTRARRANENAAVGFTRRHVFFDRADQAYFTTNSMRRFLKRPLSVLLSASGLASP
ncbi:hypothetical protein BVER_05549 [Candidatus Burkholderia verschuerenii]|uniref:Uncharacterized protein n=1 Tax=Candidatus Burkholderia verschuerenii TaxID=242163 RepID=A0A0L0MFJ3_9BURK|nr:hypothetical protein BVER_05549 [Candidatus Burkholderia verschuerenii]